MHPEFRPDAERLIGPREVRTLAEGLTELRRSGAAHVPRLAPDEMLAAIHDEIANGPFEDESGQYLRAEQRLASYQILTPYDRYPAVRGLAGLLERSVRQTIPLVAGSGRYRANRAGVHRYPAGDVGITPHYDEKQFTFMVAAVTVEGSADFLIREDPGLSDSVVADRLNAPVLARWRTEPGSLVLLRAPGFDGAMDGRPLHEVRGGTGDRPRLALVYRMDAG